MIDVLLQEDWNEVLTGAGFITVNMPCLFTFKESPTLTDIHFTTNAQIYGKEGLTLYIKNPNISPENKLLTYAKEP